MRFIERKYHTFIFIRTMIEQQLVFEPHVETRSRKILTRASDFGARWELRFGDNDQFRVFYSVYPAKAKVHILAVGIKVRERLYMGEYCSLS
ncbi:MAG TPA: addiction module toxin RelE [Anaerolineae bacterium]|nr:addiction module toxin RelE [Anaerolineae bacterium]HQH37432.1 addiction module toxin RelE [Anaerolineae bacterium]